MNKYYLFFSIRNKKNLKLYLIEKFFEQQKRGRTKLSHPRYSTLNKRRKKKSTCELSVHTLKILKKHRYLYNGNVKIIVRYLSNGNVQIIVVQLF